MSWSGFRKAINRAGTQVMLKTGQMDSSVDEEFEEHELNFKLIENNSIRLLNELQEFDKLLDSLMDSQISIATTIDKFYGEGSRDGISQMLLEKLIQLKTDVLPEIDEPLQVTVLEPLTKFKELTAEFRALIKKRLHKKLDFDLLTHKLNKLENELKLQHQNNLEKDRTLTELNKVKAQYSEASKVYSDLNETLKAELQQFISLRSSIVDHSFESFVKIQNKLFSQLDSEMDMHYLPNKLTHLNGEMDDIMLQLKDISKINLSVS